MGKSILFRAAVGNMLRMAALAFVPLVLVGAYAVIVAIFPFVYEWLGLAAAVVTPLIWFPTAASSIAVVFYLGHVWPHKLVCDRGEGRKLDCSYCPHGKTLRGFSAIRGEQRVLECRIIDNLIEGGKISRPSNWYLAGTICVYALWAGVCIWFVVVNVRGLRDLIIS